MMFNYCLISVSIASAGKNGDKEGVRIGDRGTVKTVVEGNITVLH